MLIGTLILGIPPLIISGAYTLETPLSYFANIPLRTVLPILLILTTLIFLPGAITSIRLPWVAIFLGLFSGITALNNIDFGLPAAIAVLSAMSISSLRSRKCIETSFAFAAGFIVPMLMYSIFLQLNGSSLDASAFLFYAQIFGIDGFFLVPMEGFGLHVLIVSLFVSATVIGLIIFLNSSQSPLSIGYKQGLALFLSGSWSLMTLPYYSGRSLVPTLFGGYAVQIALVAVCFLPVMQTSFVNLIRNSKQVNAPVLAPVIMSFLCVGLIGALWSYAATPSKAIDGYFKSGPVIEVETNIGEMTSIAENLSFNRTKLPIGQALSGSNIIELEAGFPSALGLNSPEPLSISPAFTRYQCEHLAGLNFEFFVIKSEYADLLPRETRCKDFINSHLTQELITEDNGLSLLKYLSPSKLLEGLAD